MDETTIRNNLKKARNSSGFTQAELADRLEISLTAYQKIESGKTRILNPNFTKCAGSLGISLSELVNGYSPVEDATAMIADVKESYGQITEELKRKDREIEHLTQILKDKDETIKTQKILIARLMEKE